MPRFRGAAKPGRNSGSEEPSPLPDETIERRRQRHLRGQPLNRAASR